MANHDLGVTTGNVVFGAPTLTVNPPAKSEEKKAETEQVSPLATETKDGAAHQDDG